VGRRVRERTESPIPTRKNDREYSGEGPIRNVPLGISLGLNGGGVKRAKKTENDLSLVSSCVCTKGTPTRQEKGGRRQEKINFD